MNPNELTLVLNDDPTAVSRFLEALEPLIAGIARGRYRLAAPDVDDVRATMLEKLWDQDKAALRRWRGEGTLRSYLKAIVHRHCLMALRSRRRFQSEVATELDQFAAPSAPEPLTGVDMAGACCRAVADLSERDRLMLEMRYMEGRGYTEITDATGMTYGAARKAVHSAVRRLRDRVREVAPEYFAA